MRNMGKVGEGNMGNVWEGINWFVDWVDRFVDLVDRFVDGVDMRKMDGMVDVGMDSQKLLLTGRLVSG